MDVRTENATEDWTHLDAFCIKDKGQKNKEVIITHNQCVCTLICEGEGGFWIGLLLFLFSTQHTHQSWSDHCCGKDLLTR